MIGKACIGVTILYKLQRDCALLWQSRKKDFSPHSLTTMGFLHRLRVAVWGVPPDTAAERRLLFKIDFFVLTYVCLMYWVGRELRHLASRNERLADDQQPGQLP
jgi:hypothetical protein